MGVYCLVDMSFFKSKFIGLTVLIVAFVAFIQPVMATDFTRVRGNVYNVSSGGRVAGETVTVNCDGVVKSAVTDVNGLYVVDYSHAECNQYRPVTATVSFNGQTQNQTVYISHDYRATLDFYFGATGVPEFGLIPGIVAATASAGSYLMLRRKRS